MSGEKRIMRVAVVLAQMPFTRAATEDLAEELIAALHAAGHVADLVRVPFNPAKSARIPDQMLACRLLELDEIDGQKTDRVIALNFPAYLVRHPHKTVLLFELFEPAYDLWNRSAGSLIADP